MDTGTVQCAFCGSAFTIDLGDKDFYEKIGVPLPTWCPECRLIRRLTWRNERFLSKRICDRCGTGIVAMYHEDEPFPVYCRDCWYSDKWDPLSYGAEYDFSKPFFLQWKELYNRVPRLNLWQIDMADSPYSNIGRECRNAYLSYSIVGGGGENIFYSKGVDTSSNVFDSLNINDCESCYWNIHNAGNANSHYCTESRNCIDSWFLFDCRNCQNCVLSSNLRNKRYVIENVQYDKEAYSGKLKELDLGSYRKREEARGVFERIVSGAVHKYADIVKTTGSSGNYIANAKDAVACFNVYDVENIKYCLRVLNLKDSYDVSYHVGSELVYEYVSGGIYFQRVRFAMANLETLQDADYTDHCGTSSNLFGCIGVRNKKYCILNRQYDKDDYETMRERVMRHMNDMPYVDEKGRRYGYGEFFPVELSPFGYNETITQEHFPIAEQNAEDRGYRWRAKEKTDYGEAMSSGAIPDHIDDVDDGITGKTIACMHHEENRHDARCGESCTTAFKVTPFELQFYRNKGIPIPRSCPNCRHFERLSTVLPFRTWRRRCMCDYEAYKNSTEHMHHKNGQCPNEFETSYVPDRNEIVYCEQCYQAEVS